MQSIESKIIARVFGHGTGWAFSYADFVDLATRSTVDWSLYRLETSDMIRRVIRGIYDYPGKSSLLKEKLPPDMPQIAQALARKFGWRIMPSGETALNILDISNQVPARYVYVSTGRSTTYQIEKRELEFKKGMLKESNLTHPESALLVQAIRALGKEGVTPDVLDRLRAAIPSAKHKQILKDTRPVTGWIYEVIQTIYQ